MCFRIRELTYYVQSVIKFNSVRISYKKYSYIQNYVLVSYFESFQTGQNYEILRG
jgi:hypothetical protein